MKILSKLDSLDNIQDGNTRKLITKATSSGSGNAVTAVSVSGDTITYTKGSTFLTGHQSAFSNVKVGSSTVAADQAGDTLELVAGSNITLTPDTTNDKVTIAATVPTKTSDLTNDSGFITSDSDEKVKQTANTSSNSALRVLFAPNVLDTDYTGNVNKNSNFTYNPSTKALATGGTVDGYKLAAASAKGVDTSIAAASTSTNLPTSQAVAGFVEGKGYTSNTGTITGVSVKGSSVATSGVANIISMPWDILTPIETKTYTDIIGDSDDNAHAKNGFLFGSVRPNSYTEPWMVKYRVRTWVPSNTNYDAVSEVVFIGEQGNMNAYRIFNHIYSTSYRPVYYHVLYRLKSAGFTAGYGHALGISLSDSTNRGNTSLKRNFIVELYEYKNCTVTLNDTAVKYANWTGTGTTNYNDISTYNYASNGMQETGDNDDTCQLRSYYDRPLVDTNKLYGYNICTLTSDDKLTGFVTSYSTGTTKTKNSATFKINAPMWYYASSTEKAANTYTGDNTLCNQYNLIDFRYSTNCGTTLTANKPVYLVGVPNGITYTLADTWWTQTLPSSADGKIYIYLGIALDTYRISWQIEHPIYWYKDGAVKLYIPSAGDLAYINKGSGSSKFLREDGSWQTVPSSGGTITGVSINNTSIATSGVANIVTNGTYNSSTNKIATMSDVPSFTFTDISLPDWS